MIFQNSTLNQKDRNVLWLILLVALLLRLAAACGLQYLLDYRWHRPFLISGDADGYWMLAQRLAAGENYSIYTPPRYVLRMPGFPALLAVPVFFFGPSLFAARIFLAGVGTLACWLTYRLGRQIFSSRVGLLAAAVTAVSPVLIVFTETILSETAFAATLLWSLLAGHDLYRRLGGRPAIAEEESGPDLVDGKRNGFVLSAIHTGIAIAAGVMMRPSWILAAPIVFILLFLTTPMRGRALFSGLILTGTMVLALLPWGIRNQQVTGHFTLTTFWMGPSLYDGLNPHATGDSNMEFFDRDNLMNSMSEFDVDQHYRQKAWKFTFENPGRFLQLAWAKTLRYWSPWPNADQFGQWWAKIVVSLFSIPLFFFAFRGSFFLFDCSRRIPGSVSGSDLAAAFWSMAILAGPILYFAVIHLFFVSSLRYRLPAEYPLFILAAYGLCEDIRRFRQRT